MATERHDLTAQECLREDNVDYVRRYTDWILPKVKGRVLDIGCGHGYFSKMMAEKDSVVEVIGTDKLGDDPRNMSHPKLTRICVETGKLSDYGKFDIINSTEHIEHLDEDTQLWLLGWIKEHLTSGGIFVGSMPNVDSYSGNPYHIKEYSADGWRVVLERYFKNVLVQPSNPALQVWICSN
jgi:2-polyprenyl-3-methyl-5-hydroxy-6-metoxy-1,4-benzoquinol methylase